MANKKVALPNNAIIGVMEGTLYLYQKGTFKKNKIYYASLIAASQSGVARLELYENEKHSLALQPSFMVVGSDVVKVERTSLAGKETRNCILISTRNQNFVFCVQSSSVCEEWLKCIQETLIGEVHGVNSCRDEMVFSEINEIYEPVGNASSQVDEYLVAVDEMTRAKMGMEGKVRLVLEDESIVIIALSGKMIVRWSLKEIRKFSFTQKTFSVEAGRNSSLGEGNFVFFTDKGEAINSIITVNRRKLRLKMDERKHCGETKPHIAPMCLPEAGPVVSKSNWGTHAIYDTIEEVPLLPLPTRQSSSEHLGPQWTSSTMPKSHVKPVSSTRMQPSHQSIHPSAASQSRESPPLNHHMAKIVLDYEDINQAEGGIYSEPEIVTDAWKSHACDDGEDSELYSNLNFSQSKNQEVESHYWKGTLVRPPVDARQEKVETQVEAIYASVDLSKKTKCKKP